MCSNAEELDRIASEFGWAVDIVKTHFERGLKHLSSEHFLRRRYAEFEGKRDPIYYDLLTGMEDEPLAKTFISYWTIAQTLATQSRFWLEDAITDILITRAIIEERTNTRVYSQAMLGAGWLERGIDVGNMGEEVREELSNLRPWRPLVHREALELIDRLVGEEERQRPRRAERHMARDWQSRGQSRDKDEDILAKITGAMRGDVAEVTLHCNLLVIEPDRLDARPHAWALRFVNPKTIASYPARKQERVNLLRLHALLIQDKILRDPKQIEVAVAEILPRTTGYEKIDRYPDHFTPGTHWSSAKLWKFIGVPFAVVTLGIRDAAATFRELLRNGLRGLLPESPAGDASRR